jgi:hypothetical protein
MMNIGVEPIDLNAAGRCGVDGCTELLTVEYAGYDLDGTEWLVLHGSLGEAARRYTTEVLLVTTGYRPWVRQVHDYEQWRSEA